VRVAPSSERYPDQAARNRFADAVLDRVRALPGVEQTGVGTTLPFHLDGWSAVFRPETGPKSTSEQNSSTTHRVVTPGYLETMGMKLTRGRLIDEHDQAGSPSVAVITETFAERIWPGEDPVGKRLRRIRTPDRLITVVGVVAPVKEDRTIGVRGEDAVWYLPYAQTDFTDPVHIVVKGSSDPRLLGQAIAGAVRAVDPQQPIFELTELEPYVAAFLAPERFAVTLLGGLAALGLLLAALGIYGVSAYFVGLRQREIGVRLALGATPGAVRRLVLGRSLRLLAIGLAAGLAGALVLGKIFASLLHEVSPHDTGVLSSVMLLLAVVALLASWLPAHRASRLDPLVALRAE
jgi:predicted permease